MITPRLSGWCIGLFGILCWEARQITTSKAIRQRVRIHDRYQLEIKLEYPLLPGKRTRYHLDMYVFISHNLAINELSYSPNEFYRRLQNYIRFKTPELSLTELLIDPASPLQIMDRIWQEPVMANDAETIERLVEQFKFLRVILRRALNRTLQQRWRKFLAKHHPPDSIPPDSIPPNEDNSVDLAEALLANHVALVQEILARLRIHAHKIEGDVVPERLRYSYRLTDEAISVVVESNLLHALRMATTFPAPGLKERAQCLLVPLLHAEFAHRQQQGYESLLPNHGNGSQSHPVHEVGNSGSKDTGRGTAAGNSERYLHHLSLLKKYTSSVLYLTTSLQTEGETVEHFLFAIVAGISMIFATVIAFYVQSVYGNFTSPLFVALVVGYMFKDRIKEIGRSISKTILRHYYYDRRVYVYTRDRKQRLGRIREKMVFLTEKEIPSQVQETYHAGRLSPIEIDGYGEHVLRYSRNVRLIADAFRRVSHEGPPITGISDILRFDIRPFLHKMDNPSERRYYLDGDTLRTIKLDRVYYINIVSTYRRAQEKKLIISKNVRVTLNRKGLVRLEEL